MSTDQGSKQLLGQGRYRLEEVIGSGGFATVYRGFDTSLQVWRAIKVLNPTMRADQAHRRRLQAEARAMARLAHPNVLTVHDIGQDGGLDFFVMELAENGSLADMASRGDPLPASEAVSYAIQVLSALAVAHAAGIIHRDIKPQNILLERPGVTRLADFGIAMLSGDAGLRTTKTGAAMGSLSYMAPEQRQDARNVGPAADIYALGCTLYNLITDANPIDLFTAEKDSPRWRTVPEPLRPILLRATRFEPEQRYPDARTMATELLAALEELGGWAWSADPVDPLAVPQATDIGQPPRPSQLDTATREAITFMLEATREEAVAATPEQRGPTAVPPDTGPSPSDTAAAPTFYPVEQEAQPPAKERPSLRWPWVLGLAALLAVGAGGFALWQRLPAEAPAQRPAAEPAVEAAAQAPEKALPEPEPEASADEEPPVAEAEIPAPKETEPVRTTPAPPAPVPTEPRAEAPATDPGPPPLGSWRGSFGGRVATLTLQGDPENLQGSLAVRFRGNSSQSELTGSFDPATGRLVLEDADRERYDAGSYEAQLSEDKERLEGRFSTFSGDRSTAFSFMSKR